MLTAKEAKELAKNSNYGYDTQLQSFLEYIEDFATEGFLECEIRLESGFPPEFGPNIVKSLENLGYVVSLGESEWDEDAEQFYEVLKVNWRMA